MTAAAPASKPDAVADAPRRKGLGRRQLEWCRKWLRYEGAPIFADMERASKAAKAEKK